MTTLMVLDQIPGRPRHRKTQSADRSWVWTLVAGVAYLVTMTAYGVLEVLW